MGEHAAGAPRGAFLYQVAAAMSGSASLNMHVRQIAQGLLEKAERSLSLATATRDLYSEVAAAIDESLTQLNKLQLWGTENRLPSSEIWNVAGQLLSKGWLQNQARTKPRGYAGDYEMLAWIYENRLGNDPLGQLFDRYFQAQAAPQAVRNRMAMMVEWIVEAATHYSPGTSHHALRIAVVGSAFGLEIRDALLRLDDTTRARLQITLLDVDPAAIDFAREWLQPLLGSEQLVAASTNLFRLPDRPAAAAPLAGSHLIFCAGLFDYLDDTAAMAMLRCLYDRLAVGGRLIVFQFAPHNPTRAYMEWFGNWYLTYRNATEFQRLVESAGLSAASVVYGTERLGIDLFAAIERS